MDQTESKRISILTQNMNIHHFVPHSYNARDSRVDGLLKILPKFDIIALQEVFTFNFWSVWGSDTRDKITQAWGHHAALSDSAPWLQQDSGLVILSKYKISETKSIFYRDRNPKEYFSKKGALRAKIEIDEKNALYVITTHLDAHVGEMRDKQLAQLKSDLIDPIMQENPKILLVGDFNIDASEKRGKGEFDRLIKLLAPLEDIWRLGSYAPSSTYTDGHICLDHIFLSQLSFDKNTFNINTTWTDTNGTPISDHYGVSVDILI